MFFVNVASLCVILLYQGDRESLRLAYNKANVRNLFGSIPYVVRRCTKFSAQRQPRRQLKQQLKSSRKLETMLNERRYTDQRTCDT